MSETRPIFDPDRIRVPRERPAVPSTLTVSQLNAMVKRVLGDALPGTLHVVGEMSNLSQPASGHIYWTLKDDRGEVRCVMWKSAAAALKFKPKDGMEVIATGHVDVYAPRGQYQFYVRKLEPRGVGSLELAFKQMRERLAREGLFEPEHKKPIPAYPRHIAVVTSGTGAAIRDIFHTICRRFPCVRITVHPVRVQGEGAAEEIARAVRTVNRHCKTLGGIDTLIVARGGGSLEDLWAFNEEVVARAIFASKIPVISGVGHEVDVTITDLVADLRAPTPTAAAELAVPVLADVLDLLAGQETRMRRGSSHSLTLQRARLDRVAAAPLFRSPLTLVSHAHQQVDESRVRLRSAVISRLGMLRRELHEAELTLAAIQPQTLLPRQHRRLERLASRLQRAGSLRQARSRQRLHAREIHLLGVHPRALLAGHEQRLADADRQLRWTLRRQIERSTLQLRRQREALRATSPRRHLVTARANVQAVEARLKRATAQERKLAGTALESLAARLATCSHEKTLARGFSITRGLADRRIISAADQVAPGQKVTTQTADGEFTSEIVEE